MENISTLNSQSSLQLSKTIQDFALAADFGSVLVDIHGKETSDLYNFSPFCQIMRSKPEFKSLCQKCDAFGGLEASKNGNPCIYRCHAGLTDISLPIIRNNQLIGFALFGQVEMNDDTENSFTRIHPIVTHWESSPELRQARKKSGLLIRLKLNLRLLCSKQLATTTLTTLTHVNKSSLTFIQTKKRQKIQSIRKMMRFARRFLILIPI